MGCTSGNRRGWDVKGVTQMRLTAPVQVYLASFLVSSGTASYQATKAFLKIVLVAGRSAQPHGPGGQSAAGNEVSSNLLYQK